MEQTTRAGRTTAAVAWSAAAVALGAAALTGWLGVADVAATGGAASLKPVLLTAVWVVPGVLLAVARPRLVLGWLALGEALLFAAAGLGEQWIRQGGDGGGADIAWAAWVTDRFSAFLAVGVWLVLVLLPDGRLPSPRWRPAVGAILAVQCLALAAFATVRGPAAGPDTGLPESARAVANPVGVLPPEVGSWVEGLDTVLLQLPLLLCLAAYVVRLRRAGPDERVRVVGILLAASTFVLLVVLGHAWLPQVSDALDVLAGGLLAVALTAAVLGRHPQVVAAIVRQAFVYTVLTACVGGLAVLVAALVRQGGQDLPTFGVAVLAGEPPSRCTRCARGWPDWSTGCSTATCATRTGRCSGWPSRRTAPRRPTPSSRGWPPRSRPRSACRGPARAPAGTRGSGAPGPAVAPTRTPISSPARHRSGR